MARKKSEQLPTDGRRSAGERYAGNRLKWVDGYLNDDDKRWLAAHLPEMDRWVLNLIGEQAEGYKISTKYNGEIGKYQATLLPDDPDCINAGFGLSHRAGDPVTALYVLSYKHFVKFDGKWGETETSGEPASQWD